VQPSRQPQTRSKVGSTVGRQLHPAHLIVIGVVLLPLLAVALTRGGWPFGFVGAHAYAPGPEVLARRRLQTIAGQTGNDPKGNTEICKDRFAPARISFNRGGFHDPKGDLLRQL
jgi:hypothetical protein